MTECTTQSASLEEIAPWRDLYRGEMQCQVVHDSLHPRPGWTEEYWLEAAGRRAGYGSVVVGGPWKGTRTIFEFYVLPNDRNLIFSLFERFAAASGSTHIMVQTNDPLLTPIFHGCAKDVWSENIVFEDRITTAFAPEGVAFQRRDPEGDWALSVNGVFAAKGGVLFHYNRPYGDIYMDVEEPFRRRGLGAYIVQELKRECYAMGSVPCARCSTENLISRKTLQKAGFVPCAHILNGSL